MANLERIVRARLTNSIPAPSSPGSNIDRILEAKRLALASPDRQGFLDRATQFLGNTLGDPNQDMSLGISPEDVAQGRALISGMLDPTLKGIQALAQIPGLFTDMELPTDRAALYLERLRVGLTTEAESAAISSGLDPQVIADAHLFGEVVGFTAPVVASLKLARLATGIRGPVISLQRNFKLDTAAGLIFGSTLIPEEEIQQRALNSLQESALFGVGGLIMNGLIFSATGMKFARATALQGQADLATQLNRIAAGGRVVLGEEGVKIAQLLSEEGFLASSQAAQALLDRGSFDSALIQSIRSSAEAGLSRGFARQVGPDFASTSEAVKRFRAEFPALKFDIIKRGGEFDVHFGLTGLNNQQKSQLAREGRYAGQMVQKGDAVYSYVRRGKEGSIIVRTVDGRTTTLKEVGVTDLPVASEEVPLPLAGQALYEDFREFVFGKMKEAGDAGGGLDEVDIIRFIRQGQLGFDDAAVRSFESPGAVTHPSEIGLGPNNKKFSVQAVPPEGEGLTGNEFAYILQDAQGNPAGSAIGEIINDVIRVVEIQAEGGPGALGTGTMRDVYREIIKDIRSRGVDPKVIVGSRASGTQPGRQVELDVERLMRGDNSAEGFAAAYQREGSHSGGLLEPEPIRRMDDAFEAWLKVRNLSPTATDIEAFRANFQQRLRSDIWALVPGEDLATMRAVQEETFRLIEAKDLPFAVRANSKGFHVERGTDGAVTFRDINSGARLTFVNEEVADRALNQMIRSEKDPLSDFLTPGAHGGHAFTGGFDPTDGAFTFDVNIAPHEFLTHLPTQAITNRRDYLVAMEDLSGVPIFNDGFALVDEGMVRMRTRLQPLGERIARIWKGIDRDGRKQVADFWTSIEGSDLAGVDLVRSARRAGLSSRQIQALTQARQMFDFGAEQIGLPESRFISNYYSRVRPEILSSGDLSPEKVARLLADDPIALREYQFWAEMSRTGELSQIELDPEIVMHKYFRSLMYKQEVAPAESRVRRMMGLRIQDLTPTQQRSVLQRSLPGTSAESFVFPREVRGMLQEYINNIRGDNSVGFASARRFTTRLFNSVGIKAAPELFDQLHSTLLSMQYGAALGLRFISVNRDVTQTLWTMYTRVGARFGSEALTKAMDISGFDEALAAGAIRSIDVAVPQGDAIFNAWFSTDIAKGSGPLSNAAAAMIRQGVRLGSVTRKTAQKFLVPYGSADQVTRAWAYHWQKLHTAEAFAKYDAGRIDWDGFLEEGLPFFSQSIKQGFRRRLDAFGREPALQWISKQAADEAHFIFGAASTPTWMQTPFGRLFGVFGQWPLWAKQLYFNRMAHGSARQIAAFWARTAALSGAFANMSLQTGINMWSWFAPAAIGFSGGPVTDMAITARDIWSSGSSLDQRANATRRLAGQVGGLALPGQLFYKDFAAALDSDDPAQAALRLTLGRPSDSGFFNLNFDFISNPRAPAPTAPPPQSRIPNLTGLPRLP